MGKARQTSLIHTKKIRTSSDANHNPVPRLSPPPEIVDSGSHTTDCRADDRKPEDENAESAPLQVDADVDDDTQETKLKAIISTDQSHTRKHRIKNPWTCDECGIVFSGVGSVGRATKHQNWHQAKQLQEILFKHVCGICKAGFESQEKLDEHMLELIGKEVVSCMECRGLFEGKKALKAHAEMGLCLWPQSEYIPAETSAEIDPKLRKMELDVRKLDPKEVLECDLCDLRYTSTFMKSHIIEHHPDSQQFRDIKVKSRNVRYPCEYCMTVLPKSHLLKHLNIVYHKVNYVTCEGCGDAHPSVAQKNRHRKSGACQGPGKSRFKCSLCPNRTPFTTDGSYNAISPQATTTNSAVSINAKCAMGHGRKPPDWWIVRVAQ